MQDIERMLSQRKEDKDLCRETTLYNMCDNMLADLDQLQLGIQVVNSQHETAASHNMSVAKVDRSFNQFTAKDAEKKENQLK